MRLLGLPPPRLLRPQLDQATVRNLEILRSLRTGDAKGSLMGVLDTCKSAAGRRMLRASLLQPSTDLNTINTRLDCVEELGAGGERLVDVQKLLPAFADTDRVLRYFMQRSNRSGVVDNIQ